MLRPYSVANNFPCLIPNHGPHISQAVIGAAWTSLLPAHVVLEHTFYAIHLIFTRPAKAYIYIQSKCFMLVRWIQCILYLLNCSPQQFSCPYPTGNIGAASGRKFITFVCTEATPMPIWQLLIWHHANMHVLFRYMVVHALQPQSWLFLALLWSIGM